MRNAHPALLLTPLATQTHTSLSQGDALTPTPLRGRHCADLACIEDRKQKQRASATSTVQRQAAEGAAAKPPCSVLYLTPHGATQAKLIRAAHELHRPRDQEPSPPARSTLPPPTAAHLHHRATSAISSQSANSRTHTPAQTVINADIRVYARTPPAQSRSGSTQDAMVQPNTNARSPSKEQIPKRAQSGAP